MPLFEISDAMKLLLSLKPNAISHDGFEAVEGNIEISTTQLYFINVVAPAKQLTLDEALNRLVDNEGQFKDESEIIEDVDLFKRMIRRLKVFFRSYTNLDESRQAATAAIFTGISVSELADFAKKKNQKVLGVIKTFLDKSEYKDQQDDVKAA